TRGNDACLERKEMPSAMMNATAIKPSPRSRSRFAACGACERRLLMLELIAPQALRKNLRSAIGLRLSTFRSERSLYRARAGTRDSAFDCELPPLHARGAAFCSPTLLTSLLARL